MCCRKGGKMTNNSNMINTEEQEILRDILNDLRNIQKEQNAIFEKLTEGVRKAKEEFEANNPYAEAIAQANIAA